MKALVLAEKPSVARDIARVLKCSKKQNGALEGEKYIVTWALGHLVTLADPEEYDKKYKEWNLSLIHISPYSIIIILSDKSSQIQGRRRLVLTGNFKHSLFAVYRCSVT